MSKKYKHVPIYWLEIIHGPGIHTGLATQYFPDDKDGRDKVKKVYMRKFLKLDGNKKNWDVRTGEI